MSDALLIRFGLEISHSGLRDAMKRYDILSQAPDEAG
jgi:hypothetical protein